MNIEELLKNPQGVGKGIKKQFIFPFIAISIIFLILPAIIRTFGVIGVIFGIMAIIAIIYFSLSSTFRKFGVMDLLKGKMPDLSNLTKSEDIPNAQPAIATVISSQQGGSIISYGTQKLFELLINVNVKTASENWNATIKQMTPLTQVGMFQPGLTFSVLYDPNDKSRVVIDQTKKQNDMNSSANVKGYEQYTYEDFAKAAQVAPQEFIKKIQQSSALLNELKVIGVQSTARVLGNEIVMRDYMPGIHILKVVLEVSGTIINVFESEQYCLTPETSLYKFNVGKRLYIRYDPKNPRRLAISGSDSPDNSQIV
ncbi:MAG: hypothetical protein J5I91_04415 [Bacteroidetes bacterium]|nr:hypothetical protein [Bacteroidota bacterium]